MFRKLHSQQGSYRTDMKISHLSLLFPCFFHVWSSCLFMLPLVHHHKHPHLKYVLTKLTCSHWNHIIDIFIYFSFHWIIKLVTELKSLKLSLITNKIVQHYIALLYCMGYQYQVKGMVQLTYVIHMHDMCSLVCGCTWWWLFISLGIIKWHT